MFENVLAGSNFSMNSLLFVKNGNSKNLRSLPERHMLSLFVFKRNQLNSDKEASKIASTVIRNPYEERQMIY